mmetsp:Transcript_31280/g.35006  ORF Transcript_31280/g.35006 Transcript_31280/m.35006 type:complete len:141 (-) Transcript_31280:190-612(-)
MSTENTSLKIATQDEDSNSAQKMSIDKRSIYQNPFFIIASSLLALLVLVAVAGTNGDQHLQSSTHKIAEGGVALADYQVDSTNLALTKDIFGLNAVEGCSCKTGNNCCIINPCSCCKINSDGTGWEPSKIFNCCDFCATP